MMLNRQRPPRAPGRILKLYYLEPRKVSITAFAEATGLTRKHVSQIVNGHAAITAETAERFAQVLGTSAQYWLNLQNAMDLYAVREKFLLEEGKPIKAMAFPADLAGAAP